MPWPSLDSRSFVQAASVSAEQVPVQPRRAPGFSCSDFTPQPRASADVTVPYWPTDLAVDVDAPVRFSAWGVE